MGVKIGNVRVKTTVDDVLAAAKWLLGQIDHTRNHPPRGTVLTGPPEMTSWHTQSRALARLANELMIKAGRRRSSVTFDLVIERRLLIEFRQAYAPTQFVQRQFMTGLRLRSDIFASAVDKALSGKAGRPRLTRDERKKRLLNPAPCYAVGERQRKRLRGLDRIEARQINEWMPGGRTILTS